MTKNPDLIQHPNLPMKMNRYDRQDFNVYWQGVRAGYMDQRQSPEGSSETYWDFMIALEHPDGSVIQNMAWFRSVEDALEQLRKWTPVQDGVEMDMGRAQELRAAFNHRG